MHEGWMHRVVRAVRSMLDPIAALRLAALRLAALGRGRVWKTLLGHKKKGGGGREWRVWGRISAMCFSIQNNYI